MGGRQGRGVSDVPCQAGQTEPCGELPGQRAGSASLHVHAGNGWGIPPRPGRSLPAHLLSPFGAGRKNFIGGQWEHLYLHSSPFYSQWA